MSLPLSIPEQAYAELAKIFTTRHEHNQTLEIEILPPGFGTLLHDGCSVGITKKVLVGAFVAARRVFFEKQSSTKTEELYEDEDVLRASEIIILFAAEHATACNWRKRRLVKMLEARNDDTLETLDTELTLTASYLCSPLHRHTKSPTLWQHRLWVLRRTLGIRELGETPKATQSLLQSELSIVLRSGELHPRNYYAFSYMRQLHTLLSKTGPEAEDITIALLERTMSWCQANTRDISGWMFALYLLEAIPDRWDVQARVVDTVVRFALDIGWTGESLWTFVDLAIRKMGVVDAVRGLLETSAGEHDGTALPGKSWKTWLGMAETYWAAAT
ncbi:uncharacterized protein ASPGLDRAFT_120240 [Aspergillus glaucus CBS 516.65]|uniref:Uncharacterized protein n=1 Tax=Aspergillus glaucus CBS 516.65 TaxID=1160497 RepID=A0A1L9VTB8_ASPGL|nr:hypothetical protein ASPGLDRAFT_120240 [Aspergillus glaucus CBS 516.65]OJJ87136.1 hypothetical protein ASPGLDRAFT_120240 [Aspergillus glaucus CBS 516.65]